MKYRNLTKTAVGAIAGFGASVATASLLRNNADPRNKPEELVIWGGSYVVGAMVAERVRAFTDAKIDAAFDFFEEAREIHKTFKKS